MDDKILKNQNNTFQETTSLEDYEINVVKKISFWTNLIYKIKNNGIKLLPSGNTKPQKTYKSIFYMWAFGSFKNSIFNALDNLKTTFSKSQDSNFKNSINLQIINQDTDYNTQTNDESLSIIIPKPINITKNL